MCPCGRFPMQPTVQGSDKVDVEAIYCPLVLDNSATGETLGRFSVLLDRVYVENLELEQKKRKWKEKKRKKVALPSAISEHSFQNRPGSAHW